MFSYLFEVVYTWQDFMSDTWTKTEIGKFSGISISELANAKELIAESISEKICHEVEIVSITFYAEMGEIEV